MIARIRRHVDEGAVIAGRHVDGAVMAGAYLTAGACIFSVLAAIPILGAFRGGAGILAGALVTVAVGQYFHRRASRDLRKEADALRRESEKNRYYTDALISNLEAGGVIEVRRDSQGHPIKIQLLKSRDPQHRAAIEIGGGGTLGEQEDPPSGKEDKPSSESAPADE